jgi:hypothetical protein
MLKPERTASGEIRVYEEDKRRRLGDAALDTPKAKFARFARG